MLYYFSALGIISIVLGLAAVRRISIYSPMVIGAVVWLTVFIAGLIFYDRFYPLSDEAFLAWMIWFLITSAIYFLMAPTRLCLCDQSLFRRMPFDYSFFIVFLVIWLVYRVWVIGSGGSEHFFLNLRLSSNELEGFEPLGLVGRFYPLVFALFLFEHVYAHRSNRHLRALCWIWMLVYALATMGKFAVLTPILSWVVIQGVKGRMPIKRLLALGCMTFCLMLLAHFVRAGREDESTIFDVLAVYIYSPIVALGYMDVGNAHDWGGYVFRFFYAFGHSLGFSPAPADVILPYVNVPGLTNVYTGMQPFFHDFGLVGVALGAVSYGFFFGCLFFFSYKVRGFSLALFSAFSIALLGQFIGDMFLGMLSGNLQVFLALFFIFTVSKRESNVS